MNATACVIACCEHLWDKKKSKRKNATVTWNGTRNRSMASSSSPEDDALSNGFDKMSLPGTGLTHLDLANHGNASLPRSCTNPPITSLSRGASQHSLPTAGFGNGKGGGGGCLSGGQLPLHNSSCAVPSAPNGFMIPPTHYVHYHHQEQCPHYSSRIN